MSNIPGGFRKSVRFSSVRRDTRASKFGDQLKSVDALKAMTPEDIDDLSSAGSSSQEDDKRQRSYWMQDPSFKNLP